MKSFGFIPSKITPDTVKFQAPKSMMLPKKYTYRPFLSPITNQGDDPYCIPHSIATWLNWRENTKTGSKVDNHIRYSDIYYSKKVQGEGMTYQEAFDYLKKKGVKTDKGVMKISSVGFVSSTTLLKAVLIANGPCFGALPVYDTDTDYFWKRTGSPIQGWHSITIVGWNEEGYIIRNSWGVSFGDRGYITLPYSDVNSFREIWTILG
jgi:hypothetical protein